MFWSPIIFWVNKETFFYLLKKLFFCPLPPKNYSWSKHPKMKFLVLSYFGGCNDYFVIEKVLKTGLLILDHCVPADSNRSMWLVLLRQASIPGKEQPLWLRLSSITWPNLSKIFNCSWLIKAMDDWKLDAAHWRNESTFVNISIVELHIQILSTYIE